MTTPEQVFTARQVSKRLGLSLAMTRRYGATLEQITGETIRQDPRDGRLYRHDQLEVMLRAKAFIEADSRLSVDAALRYALGGAQEDATPEMLIEARGASLTLSEEHVRALLSELRGLREEVAGMRAEQREQAELRVEVAALRKEVAESKALLPSVNPERIDRAIEVEMLESIGAAESPAAIEERQAGVEVVNSAEAQRKERESWLAEVALEVLAAASELPAAPRDGREGDESTGEALVGAGGSSDGPVTRAVRWLERRLRGERE